MSNGDPLDGADVGETRRDTFTTEINPIDFEPREWYGTDRERKAHTADIEIVENEHGNEIIRITREAELTKRLPRNWDQCTKPRTDSERTQARWAALKRNVFWWLATVVTLALPIYIATLVTNEVVGELTINGQPLPQQHLLNLVPVVVVALVISFIVVRGGFGMRAGGGYR